MTPCPRCAQRTHSVSGATAATHTQPRSWTPVQHLEDWSFCPQRDCEVGYFTAEAAIITVAQMSTTPFAKSDAPGRRVCFCFGHTVSGVLADVETGGLSTIKQAITDACGRGQADCEYQNPTGRCCLGHVALVLRQSPLVTDKKPLSCCPQAVESLPAMETVTESTGCAPIVGEGGHRE